MAGDLEDPKLADAVQNELPGVLERLAPKGNSKAQPEPQALAACVLAGSSMLSHEELTTALRHVSGFAGGSCSATEIRRLAGEIRSVCRATLKLMHLGILANVGGRTDKLNTSSRKA